MVRLLRSVFLALVLTATAGGAAAQASNEWCDTDPVLVIQTPHGQLVPVYLNVGVQSPAYDPNSLSSALQAAYTVEPAQGGKATRVTVNVTVPSLPSDPSRFATRALVSTAAFGGGTVYSQTTGTSDQQMTLTFILSQS